MNKSLEFKYEYLMDKLSHPTLVLMREYVTALRDEVARLEKENEMLGDSKDSWKEECEDLRKHYHNLNEALRRVNNDQ